jgi:hypothetical protein
MTPSIGDANPLYIFVPMSHTYGRLDQIGFPCPIKYPLTRLQLPDEFKDFATPHTGANGPSTSLMTHCHRELFHAQWKLILDDEFMEAYVHGIVILCADDLQRRFYPRIFTYSADYPEK